MSSSSETYFMPRRSRLAASEHLAQKVMLAGLLVVLVGYLAFLLSSFRMKSAQPSEASSQKDSAVDVSAIMSDQADREEDLQNLNALINGSAFSGKQLVKAYDLIADGSYQEAEALIDTALQKMPGDLAAQKALAEALIGQKKYEEAKKSLIKVLSDTPDDVGARVALAGVLASQGRNRAVLLMSKWILKDHPYSIRAHYLAAISLINVGENKDAVIHLRKILNLDDEHKSAHTLLGTVYRKQGAYAKAIKLLKEQLLTDHNDSVTYYNLAICYAEQKKAHNSVDWLTQAADIFGKSFVETWLKSANFDKIRTHPAFVVFSEQMKVSKAQ